ncbi:UNVERIFIED_CONTAM: hypothetical protein GTU68_042921 [Idotea baltica]|nr:hypothetical protein [Idotea baltica]
MLMVNAGKIIDMVIEDLIPHLSEGDILIDGGNSHYKKTKERGDYLKTKNIYFIGTGVSGGEAGALWGPSIMPSGDREVYQTIAPFFNAIAAKDQNDLPCCTHIGPEGSGHFVKMVHNGIEYVEMQLLAEVYHILTASGNSPDDIANILESWREKVDGYLLEITIDILRKKEGDDWLLNKIMDKAGNKGTGNWTSITSAELGVPSTLISTALFARYTSFYKADRVSLSKQYNTSEIKLNTLSVDDILGAYTFARLINHYQGFKLIKEASSRYDWGLNLSEIARIWTNGCIIRSTLMQDVIQMLKEAEELIFHREFATIIKAQTSAIKKVVSECVLHEVPTPCLSESVNFFNAMTSAHLPANLIQAQRDYFGAHTYQRKDDNTLKFYHTNWK